MSDFDAKNISELNVVDYEANFTIRNYKDIDSLNELAKILNDMDAVERQIAEHLIDDGIIVDYDDLKSAIENDVIIYYDCENMEDVAMMYGRFDSGGDERLDKYFDYKSYGEDLSADGTFFKIDGAIVEYLG